MTDRQKEASLILARLFKGGNINDKEYILLLDLIYMDRPLFIPNQWSDTYPKPMEVTYETNTTEK